MALKVLTPDQIEQFVERGYVMLRQAFPGEYSKAVRELVWEMTGLSPDDPASWTKATVGLQKILTGPEVQRLFTPRLVGAYDDVLGEGRYKLWKEQGWWPVRFPGFAEKPWRPPDSGWHVDGIGWQHHVYSKDQGLLPIFIHSDIGAGDGGTAIIPGSHRHIARVLARSEPEGLDSGPLCQAAHAYAIDHLDETVEVTGEAGDVALMHPFMAHTSSPNTGDRVRFICNPKVVLHEHMDLHRTDPADYSPVERAIVEAAGDLLDAQAWSGERGGA